jgi:hypothetical protein
MYNFEEIKEVLMPYMRPDFGGIYFSRSTSKTDSFEVIYDKDGVTIYYCTNADYIDCIGLSDEHIDEMCDIIIKVHKEYEEEYEKEMERLQAEEEYYYEEPLNYHEYMESIDEHDISHDPEALYGCLRSSLIRHTEELLTLVDHTADTIACELQVSVQDVERIMSRLKDKIKETTNL